MGRWRGLVVTLMATWGMISSVNAAQTPCAIIDNQQGWPIIGEKCDIGNGLWGDQSPDPQSSAFWVQCGATNGVRHAKRCCAKPVNPYLSLQSYACRHWRRQKRLLCQRQAEKQANPKPPSI